MTNYPCTVSEKEVFEADKGIGCDHCMKWVHYKCNELSYFVFEYLQIKISGIASNVYLKFLHFTQIK